MLKDITLGQYFPGNTVIHRLDPRTKLIGLVCYIVALFLAKSYVSYGLMALSLVTLSALGHIRAKTLLSGLKPLLFIVIFTGVIAMMPRVLILDEPTAGLDPIGQQSILQKIMDYRRETGGTILLISHNMDDVARLATRLLVFNHGTIAMDGTPAEVFDRAEELIDMGLTVPAATEIALALRRRGVDIPESIYTINYLRKQLVSLGEGGGVC